MTDNQIRTNQPKHGEVRVIANDTKSDSRVPVAQLLGTLEEMQHRGIEIIELSTSKPDNATEDDDLPSGVESNRKCNRADEAYCPVVIRIRDHKITAGAKGSAFPKQCISCAGQHLLELTGITPTDHQETEEV